MLNSKKFFSSYHLITLGLLVLFCLNGTMQADPLRVSEEEGRKALVSKTPPTVPPLARQAHITGRVIIEMTVSEDGTVEKVDVVSGNPILASSAANAAKKWTFQPFKAGGQPTKALVRTTFEFGG